MKMEKLFPISINPQFCVRCQKCSYSCPPKAIFFRDTIRYVDYNKCEGCLKCVDVCEYNAIIVISLEEGQLVDFKINKERCNICKKCLEPNFCFHNLFTLEFDRETREKYIKFNKTSMDKCQNCLKCFKECPNNAIVPNIEIGDF
ncbi:MAG: 4Fe-4S binding protein [Candidatus Hermodarchaeota archaeon]